MGTQYKNKAIPTSLLMDSCSSPTAESPVGLQSKLETRLSIN